MVSKKSYSIKEILSWWLMPAILAFQILRKKSSSDFEISLDYTMKWKLYIVLTCTDISRIRKIYAPLTIADKLVWFKGLTLDHFLGRTLIAQTIRARMNGTS